MERKFKRKLVVGTVVGLAVLGVGGAIAATRLDTPSERSKAILDDAAKQLGVSSTALDNALKKAFADQIDADVAAGRLTQAQAEALKARIQSGQAPRFFGGQGGPFRHAGGFGNLAAAASYLGLTTAQLQTELTGGKTLAQIAGEHGKAVDGLVQALTDAATKQLDAATAAGRMTKDQEQSILSNLKQAITGFVNGTGPSFRGGGPGFGPPGAGGRPGFGPPGASGSWSGPAGPPAATT
jgi:hypothetical protein